MTIQISSISHLAGAANSKLATFLRERADAEAELIGKARPARDVDFETGRVKRRNRFSLPPSFSKPSPLGGRSETAGPRPFHLSFEQVSRPSKAASSTGAGGGRQSAQPGFDHAKYVERDGAAEVIAAADGEAYVTRPGAVETIEAFQVETRSEDEPRSGVPELDVLGSAPVVGGLLAVVSNISDDPGERQHFWKMVQEHERQTRTASIRADPANSADFWTKLPEDTLLNRELHRELLSERQRYVEHQASGSGRFKPKAIKVPIEKAASYAHAMRCVGGWDDKTPPVKVRSREARVQTRHGFELPAAFTPEERLEALRSICRMLERVEKDEHGRWVGWMYTAVVHAPDGNNDARNFHVHVLAYDRPCRYLPEYAEWDFAVSETYDHRGQTRTRFPHRQPKLVTVSQSGRAKDRQGHALHGREGVGRNYIPHLRAQVATVVNEIADRSNYPVRYHPGTNEDCGIDRGSTEHLGDDHKREQIGIATDRGNRNAEIIWNDEARALRQRHKHDEADVAALLIRADDATKITMTPAISEELLLLRQYVFEQAKSVQADRAELDLLDLAERKARSRAEVVQRYCTEQLEMRASSTERARDIEPVERRLAEARAFLAELDRLTARERSQLIQLARNLSSREQRLKQAMAQLVELLDGVAADAVDAGIAPDCQPAAARKHAIPVAPDGERPTTPRVVETSPATSGAALDAAGSGAAADEKQVGMSGQAAAPKLAAAVDQSLEPELGLESDRRVPQQAPALEFSAAADKFELVRENAQAGVRRDAKSLAPDRAQGVPAPDGSRPLHSSVKVADSAPLVAPVPSRVEIPSIVARGADQAKSSTSAVPINEGPQPSIAPYSSAQSPSSEKDEAPIAFEEMLESAPVPVRNSRSISKKQQPATSKENLSATVLPRFGRSGSRYLSDEAIEILDGIAQKRTPIERRQDGEITTYWAEPLAEFSLRAREAVLAQARLKGIYDNQQKEIGRLLSWLRTHLPVSESETAAKIASSPKSMQKLYSYWSSASPIKHFLAQRAEVRATNPQQPKAMKGGQPLNPSDEAERTSVPQPSSATRDRDDFADAGDNGQGDDLALGWAFMNRTGLGKGR